MKLTEEKLKQLIFEELKALNELDPFGGGDRGEDMPPTDAEKAAQSPEPKKDPGAEEKKVASVSKLGDELIQAGRAVKAAKIKGLDTNEIPLISAVLASVLEVSAGKSAKTLLVRLTQILDKFK